MREEGIARLHRQDRWYTSVILGMGTLVEPALCTEILFQKKEKKEERRETI
jgi:hypothetical protein